MSNCEGCGRSKRKICRYCQPQEFIDMLIEAINDAFAVEREACANAVWQYPGIGLNDRLAAITSIKARGSK